ncbi:MAG: hypothetical protein L0Z62_07955, partial [Gemmataceae bacterium]|nr:hypothetical protein [Gemmataceae bacterium]
MEWLLGGYMWLYIHRPFEVWPVLGTVQIERMYMILTLLCWLGTTGKRWVANRLHGAFAAFALVLVLAWLASPYGDLGTKTVEDFFKVAVFYVLVITTIHDEKTLKRLIVIYLAVVGLYMTHSFWEFLQGRHVYRMGIRRMIGVDTTYNDPNTFSATLLYSLPLTLPFWTSAAGGRARLLLFGYTGLSVVCILLTGSRGSLIGLCCLALLVLWTARRRGRVTALLASAL